MHIILGWHDYHTLLKSVMNKSPHREFPETTPVTQGYNLPSVMAFTLDRLSMKLTGVILEEQRFGLVNYRGGPITARHRIQSQTVWPQTVQETEYDL